MLKDLRKFIQNKEARKDSEYYGEQVLGTNTSANRFAGFWEANHGDMDVVYAALLHEWVSNRVYTEAELQAYKEGLASYQMFFQKCLKEKVMREDKEMKSQMGQ